MPTIKSARPNAHYVAISQYDGESLFVVEWRTDEDEGDVEFDTLAEAEAEYASTLEFLRTKPNWEAQAEYDAQWGESVQSPYGEY